jgi:tetratricopeptide (TPR) repeat protein
MDYLQEGNRSKAKGYFEEIVLKHPQSDINLESHFRLGEFYFDKRDFANAIDEYSHLLGKWDNPYFDLALYKLGWAYYNTKDYKNSIGTFIYLLEDLNLVEKANSVTIEKSKTDLRQEATQYVASCFTEYGGPEGAKEFLKSRKDKPYSLPIFEQMAKLYQKRDYYAEAIDTYKALLDVYPFYQNAPEIYKFIVENYELDDHVEKANEAREEIVKKFGPGSDWLRHFIDDEENYKKCVALVQETLIYLGTYYQAEAQKTNRARDYQLAIDKYKEFLDKFRYSDQAAKINFYLAESYYNASDYANAAEAYYDVVTKYDHSEFSEDAAYNRILCYYNLLGTDSPIDSVTIYIDEFLGTGELLTITVTHQSEIDLLRSCNDFVLIFPESKWLDQVLLKYGETLHELKAYRPAIKAYVKVVEMGPDKPYHLLAAMNAGQSYFDAGLYDQAEVWLRNIVENFPDSVRYIEKAKKLALSAQFKIAEKMSDDEKSSEAASMLRSIADKTDDDAFRERALFEAATQYQKAGNLTAAALALERLATTTPSSESADEALYKAAGIREMNGEWRLAAADYLNLTDHYPSSEFAARSLRNAAVCYESVEDWIMAGRLYQKFADTYPSPSADLLECLYKSGEMALKVNNSANALLAFNKTIETYNRMQSQGAQVDIYFVAQAQFMIGEVHYEEYRKVELTPPFKPNLEKKINRLKQVLNDYKNAASYHVADWTTAASYKIGKSFEELVRAFMEAPIPDGMDEEQIQVYKENLAQYAKPYKEQALQTYQKNLEQAEANNIDNFWIKESRKRYEALLAELKLNEKKEPSPQKQEMDAGSTSS